MNMNEQNLTTIIVKEELNVNEDIWSEEDNEYADEQLAENAMFHDVSIMNERYLEDNETQQTLGIINTDSGQNLKRFRADLRSIVWLYFKKEDDLIAKCELCGKNYSYRGGITNLKKHIATKHANYKIGFKSFASKATNDTAAAVTTGNSNISSEIITSTSATTIAASSPSLTNISDEVPSSSLAAAAKKRKYSLTETMQQQQPKSTNIEHFDINRCKKLDELVLKMIIKDLQPITVVENEGFQELLKEILPNYELPTRKQLYDVLLINKYQDVLEQLKHELQNVDYITLSAELWNNNITAETYISVTAHFINKSWQPKTAFLGSKHLRKTPNAISIKMAILDICQTTWSLQSKIYAIITDSNTQMQNALGQGQLGWTHWNCLAHSLNEIVQNALIACKDLRLKIKNIVEYFNKNINAANEMAKAISNCSDLAAAAAVEDDDDCIDDMESNIAQHQLIDDTETRWMTTLFMFQRICKLEQPLVATIALLQNKNELIETIDVADFAIMKQIIRFLQPFATIANELAADTFTASKLLILLRWLLDKINAYKSTANHTNIAKEIGTSLLKDLNKLFTNIENNLLLNMTTFLDPRFKNRGIKNTQALEVCKREIEKYIIKTLQDAALTANEPKPDPNSIWYNFDQMHKRENTPEKCAASELRNYCEESTIKRDCDPFEWWRKREILYPRIAALARKHLSFVATCVPSEQVFLKKNDILSAKRNQFSGNHNAERILFLNGNIQYF